MSPRKATRHLSVQDTTDLEPFMVAGMEGLRRTRWRSGDPVECLVAPIVLQVLIAVSRECRLGELMKEAPDA